MPFANLDKFNLFYESRGAGEPLVLVPGFASGAWSWFKQIEELAKHFRVITFDPRGVANSETDGDETEISIQAIADDIAHLLDRLKIERAHLLGASFGGFVALEFALKFPERLDKLILACTSFGGANHVAPSAEILAAFASTQNMNDSERIRRYFIPAFTPDFAARQPDEVEQFCRLRERNFVPESTYLSQLFSATKFDAESRVAEIKAATLVLSGDADSVVPFENSINLAKAIPNAQLKIIENGSHLFFVEQAAEFNETVRKFLEEN